MLSGSCVPSAAEPARCFIFSSKFDLEHHKNTTVHPCRQKNSNKISKPTCKFDCLLITANVQNKSDIVAGL